MPLRLFTILICLCFAMPSAKAATRLVVYTAIEPELLPLYAKAFEEENPDISLHWVALTLPEKFWQKLLAERNAPKADVVFGLSLNALARLNSEGLLEPYISAGMESVALYKCGTQQKNPYGQLYRRCHVREHRRITPPQTSCACHVERFDKICLQGGH